MFVYFEGEREWAGKGQGGGGKKRIPSRLCAASAEPDTGLEPLNHEIMTWALVMTRPRVGCLTNWATLVPHEDSLDLASCRRWSLSLPKWNYLTLRVVKLIASEFCRQKCLEVALGICFFKLLNPLNYKFQEKLSCIAPSPTQLETWYD